MAFLGSLLGGIGQKMMSNIGTGVGLAGKEGGFMSAFGTGEGQLDKWKPMENIKAGKGIFGKEGGFGSGEGKLSQIDWQGLAGRMAGTYLKARTGIDPKGSFAGSKSGFFAGIGKGLDFSKAESGNKVITEDSVTPEGAFDVPTPYAENVPTPYDRSGLESGPSSYDFQDTGSMFRSQYSGGNFKGASGAMPTRPNVPIEGGDELLEDEYSNLPTNTFGSGERYNVASSGNITIDENLPALINQNQPVSSPQIDNMGGLFDSTGGFETSDWAGNAFDISYKNNLDGF